MRPTNYDKPQKDTYEIIWELNDDVFIERIVPYEWEKYYQSHHNDDKVKSDSLWEAMIQMWVLLLKNK